ncbi:MAG: Rieske 2Fe-2S domain-containing protein [Gammaproteobacteria bacterium]
MSKALDYLLKARPQVMHSYFAFLKQAGSHLDAKTRAIISVITKVDSQTEAGFRQYLTRALQEGVTADEILDALLVAFPALGLAKIIWAIEILLEMDIPEFRIEKLGADKEWHDIANIEELKQRDVTCIVGNERGVFVLVDEEEVRVYDSICPHQSTHIPEQALNGCELTCPRHKWKFNLKTGECIENGDRPLRRLHYRIERDRLLVCW